MAPQSTYTILSMMKDEGPSLVEWVAYHRHIGFDNICVYTNNCSDGTDDMLIRLEELGHVRHFRNDVPEGKKPQPNALALGTANPQVMDSQWILTMDADEFLSIKTGRGMIDDLVAHIPPEASAMAITWRFFGSAGITDWNPGLVTESYTRAAPDKFKKGWGVKTLFKPYDHIKLGIHRPHIKNAKQMPDRAKALFDQVWVNGSGDRMPDEFSLSGWRSTKPTLGYRLAEMNHYAVKSYEGYLLRRVRGNVNNKEDKYNAAYFALFDRNETEATTASQHAAPVKALIAKMLADPVLRDLQDKAMEFHAARVAKLRATGEYDGWIAELKEASKVPLDRLDEVLFIQHLPKKWQDKVKEMQAQGVPDKTIARMIADTQTAKKGETRQELLIAAGERPAPPPADKAEETLEEMIADSTIVTASMPSIAPLVAPQAEPSDEPLDEKAARKAAHKAARQAARRAGIATKKGPDGEAPVLPPENPFLNTPEARALGVPQLKPDIARMLATPALSQIVQAVTIERPVALKQTAAASVAPIKTTAPARPKRAKAPAKPRKKAASSAGKDT
jgi:hypothetical protein